MPSDPTTDPDRLYRDVAFLTAIRPYRNHRNLESLRKAADHIEREFRLAGLVPTHQTWEAKGNTYRNVIASFQPEREQRLVIGAHYDVYKDQPGADDNASGVAGLLELGRMLQAYKGRIPYGIELVSFCLEEPPFFHTKSMGSYLHAQSLHERGTDVIGMLSLEMIGYYGNPNAPVSPTNQFLVVSGIEQHLAFNREVSQLLRRNKHIGTRMVAYDDSLRNNGPSDHRNYWTFGFPGVMLIGSDGHRNPHYHKVTDTIDTLHFGAFAQAVNSCWQVAAHFHQR